MRLRTAMTGALSLSGVAFLVLASGCLDRELKALRPCVISGVVETVNVANVDEVDLLFMIDNSNSMGEEQTSLATELPRLVRVLASGDRDGDGTSDFPPVRSLNVGVITSDMGTGGFRVQTCAEPNFGDDGRLRTSGNTTIDGCQASYPAFLNFRPEDGGDPTAFAFDVTCVAKMGTGGCGFEQQLEAILKAVTPSTSDLLFNVNLSTGTGTRGHADATNCINPGDPSTCFLRPTSLLAIIAVTDEEDCSAIDPELFNPASGVYTEDINVRCFWHPEAVHPVERFVDGLLAARENPSLLVFAAIAGVPADLVGDPDAINYGAILADSRMEERVEPDNPKRLVPSCNVPGRGIAFPPRRIVRLAQALDEQGANAVVQSICQADFSPALTAIIAKIADVLGGACLPRALNQGADGKVPCDVVEVLPTSGSVTQCAQIGGRELLYTQSDGRQVCKVHQAVAVGGVAPSEPGWYYDNFSTDVLSRCGAAPQRISFVAGYEPATGTTVRLECLQPVQSGTAGIVDVGTPCTPGTDGSCPANESRCARDLVCETTTRTWQVQCTNDATCTEQGLASFVCAPQSGFDAQAGTADDFSAPICVNPTCGGSD